MGCHYSIKSNKAILCNNIQFCDEGQLELLKDSTNIDGNVEIDQKLKFMNWYKNIVFFSLMTVAAWSAVSLEIQNVDTDAGTLDIYMINDEEVGEYLKTQKLMLVKQVDL